MYTVRAHTHTRERQTDRERERDQQVHILTHKINVRRGFLFKMKMVLTASSFNAPFLYRFITLVSNFLLLAVPISKVPHLTILSQAGDYALAQEPLGEILSKASHMTTANATKPVKQQDSNSLLVGM
jgi:chorismate-pyruvate lyase